MSKIETKHKKKDSDEAEEFEIHGEMNVGDNERIDKRLKTKREEPEKNNQA